MSFSQPQMAESTQGAGKGDTPPHGSKKIEVAATFPRLLGKKKEAGNPPPQHEDPGSTRAGGSKEGRNLKKIKKIRKQGTL